MRKRFRISNKGTPSAGRHIANLNEQIKQLYESTNKAPDWVIGQLALRKVWYEILRGE